VEGNDGLTLPFGPPQLHLLLLGWLLDDGLLGWLLDNGLLRRRLDDGLLGWLLLVLHVVVTLLRVRLDDLYLIIVVVIIIIIIITPGAMTGELGRDVDILILHRHWEDVQMIEDSTPAALAHGAYSRTLDWRISTYPRCRDSKLHECRLRHIRARP
jgi:hypothetical protein